MPSRRRTILTGIALSTLPGSVGAQAFTGWSDKQISARIARYTQLTPENVAAKVTIEDDGLEAVAKLTTEPVFRFKGSFTDRTRADSFMRALVSKSTGRTIYQVYQKLSYTGDRSFNSVDFATPTGRASTPLTINSGDVDCKYGICVWDRDLAFEVPEAVLRTIAAGATARPLQPWRFRFKAQVGEDWTDDIAPAEIAGILLAADNFRRGRGFR